MCMIGGATNPDVIVKDENTQGDRLVAVIHNELKDILLRPDATMPIPLPVDGSTHPIGGVGESPDTTIAPAYVLGQRVWKKGIPQFNK